MSLYIGIGLLVIAVILIIRLMKKRKTPPTSFSNADHVQFRNAKQVAHADNALSDTKTKFQITARTKDPEVHFMCVKATGLSQAQSWITMRNESDQSVLIKRIEWELWFGNLVKTGAIRMDEKLASGKSIEDFSFEQTLTADEVQKLSNMQDDSEIKCFVEGTVQCQTKHGYFEKKFALFNLTHVLTGLSLAKQAEGLDVKYEMDRLTGLFQRHYLEDNLQKMIDMIDAKRPLSFMMIDMDDFKHINDKYGHLVGDEAIKMVCDNIKRTIGDKGVAIRYGGDEFCVVLHFIEKDEAEHLANRILEKIKNARIKADPSDLNSEEIQVACSVGLATIREPEDYKILIKRADDMLLQSKKAGKNRVMADRRTD